MNRQATFALTVMAFFGVAVALPASDALAQQKQQVSFKTPAANTKYTQQTTVDVGDVPGHQVRVFELHRTYPSDAPVINGLKMTEMWTRGVTDFIEGTGSSVGPERAAPCAEGRGLGGRKCATRAADDPFRERLLRQKST